MNTPRLTNADKIAKKEGRDIYTSDLFAHTIAALTKVSARLPSAPVKRLATPGKGRTNRSKAGGQSISAIRENQRAKDIEHYLLIKLGGTDKHGGRLKAQDAALAILGTGWWPLWTHTKYRLQVKAGDRVAVYLAGARNMCVIAFADVRAVVAWERAHENAYPLELDGKPDRVLELGEVAYLDSPKPLKQCLERMSFYQPSKKWGVALMGGMRAITQSDFELLTR